jgi:thiol-disulfide isomerase/thioredoxin
MDILIRLLIALALIALGVGLYRVWNRWQVWRLARGSAAALPGLETSRPGIPAILYFTTPDCVPCRTTQRPALERLSAELADHLQVVEVDATLRPDLADHWGVLSIPTTFIIDASGQPRRVNHGVTSTAKLKQQLEEVDGRSGKGKGEQTAAWLTSS